MFLYHYLEETRSHCLLLQGRIGEYAVSYHHMSREGTNLVSFHQNRLLVETTDGERQDMMEWVLPLLEEYRVPPFLSESLLGFLHGTLQEYNP